MEPAVEYNLAFFLHESCHMVHAGQMKVDKTRFGCLGWITLNLSKF